MKRFEFVGKSVVEILPGTTCGGTPFVLASDYDALAARVAATDRALQVERLKFDSAIKHLTAITGMLAPDNIKLPNGRVMEFAPPVESVMDYWRGLTAAIKAARDHVDSVRNAAADGEKPS